MRVVHLVVTTMIFASASAAQCPGCRTGSGAGYPEIPVGRTDRFVLCSYNGQIIESPHHYDDLCFDAYNAPPRFYTPGMTSGPRGSIPFSHPAGHPVTLMYPPRIPPYGATAHALSESHGCYVWSQGVGVAHGGSCRCSSSEAGWAKVMVKDRNPMCICHMVVSTIKFRMRVMATCVPAGPTMASAEGRCRMSTEATRLNISWGYRAVSTGRSAFSSGTYSFGVGATVGGNPQQGGGLGWQFQATLASGSAQTASPDEATNSPMAMGCLISRREYGSGVSSTSVSLNAAAKGRLEATATAGVPTYTGQIKVIMRCTCGSRIVCVWKR